MKKIRKPLWQYTLFRSKKLVIELVFPMLALGCGFHKGRIFVFIGPFAVFIG